jgi:hypothetical protein
MDASNSHNLCRVLIPPSYRDEYINALGALSTNNNPTPLWRTIDRAQRWAALMPWGEHVRVLENLYGGRALDVHHRLRWEGR